MCRLKFIKKKTLNILIAYHKPYCLLKSNIFTPIHVGRDVAMQNTKDGKISKKDFKWLNKNLVGDNTGENISSKNREWCELTAIYWAWKNYDKIGNPDYIGLMHYRRFFDFYGLKKASDIEEFVKKYDIMILQKSNIKNCKNNYNQYKQGPGHHVNDLMHAIEILKRLYPDYSKTANDYLNMDISYFCNMFVMKKDLFFTYCEWLFSILEELEKEIDIEKYDTQERRVFGYIAERLTGIFYIYMTSKNNLKFSEIPLKNDNEIIKTKFISRIKNLVKKLRPLYLS